MVPPSGHSAFPSIVTTPSTGTGDGSPDPQPPAAKDRPTTARLTSDAAQRRLGTINIEIPCMPLDAKGHYTFHSGQVATRLREYCRAFRHPPETTSPGRGQSRCSPAGTAPIHHTSQNAPHRDGGFETL